MQDFFTAESLHANLLSFLVTISLLHTQHFVWWISLLSMIYAWRLVLILPGLMLASFLNLSLLKAVEAKEFDLQCFYRCDIKVACILHSLSMPVYGLKAMHINGRLEGDLQLISRNIFLPLLSLKAVSAQMTQSSSTSHQRPWFSSSLILQSLYDCFILGQVDYYQPWVSCLKSMGLLHFLCFSGWHVAKLHSLIAQHPSIFFVSSIGLSWLIGYPFPLVRAAITFNLKQRKYESFWCLTVGIWGGLLCDPLAWSRWSFWLACYYALLFEYKKIPSWALKITGMAWSLFLTGSIELLWVIVGILLESVVVYGFFAFCWLTVIIECLYPRSMEPLVEISIFLWSYVSHLKVFVVELDPSICQILLIVPFYALPSKEYCLKR